MFNIEAKSVGEAWVSFIEAVYEHGLEYFDDDEQIKELDDILIKMEIGSISIEKDIVNYVLDPILEKYADKHVADQYLKKIQTTEIIEELRSSYGKRIFAQEYLDYPNGFDQFKWLLYHIAKKPETKSATISLLQPNEQGVYLDEQGNKQGTRIPCLDVIDCKLRDGKLNTKVFFRSQNAHNAYANYLGIFWLAHKLARELQKEFEHYENKGKTLPFGSRVELGSLHVYVSNGHFYAKDQKKIEQLLSEYGKGLFKAYSVCDVLNNFLVKNCFRNPYTWMNDLFDAYEYCANLLTACIIVGNRLNLNEWYVIDKDQNFTMGRVIQRFRNLYQRDVHIKNILKNSRKADICSFLDATARLCDDLRKNEETYTSILEEKKVDDLKSDDMDIIVLRLFDIVLYLRNYINHERQNIQVSTYSALKDVYDSLILLTGGINLKNYKASKCIVFVNNNGQDIVYCLNAIKDGSNFIYRDMNYQTVMDVNTWKQSAAEGQHESRTKIKTSDKSIDEPNQFKEFGSIQDIRNSFIFVNSGTIKFSAYGAIGYDYENVESFYIAKYPVSNREFLHFLLNNESHFAKKKNIPEFMKDFFSLEAKSENGNYSNIRQSSLLDHAVYFIDWEDAVLYCNFLSTQLKLDPVYTLDSKGEYVSNLSHNGFRLPTELEWYYTATCGKGSKAIAPDIADVVNGDNIRFKGPFRKTKPNNELKANDWGICGMLGNINEFTNTATRKYRFKKSEERMGLKGDSKRVIIKGGSFATKYDEIKSHNFTKDVSIYNMHYIGIRLVINSLDGDIWRDG